MYSSAEKEKRTKTNKKLLQKLLQLFADCDILVL